VKLRKWSQKRIDAAQQQAKARGFDAFLPMRPEVIADPERYDFGLTCYCRGADQPPQILRPGRGESAIYALCGTVFHRFADDSGTGIIVPKKAAN